MARQLSRLDVLRIRESIETDDGGRYRYRPRRYDVPILRYVAYYRAVTLHQVIYRFFVYAGKGASYGYRVLRRLIKEGLLAAEPLDPELGASSRIVLRLTDKGWSVLGIQPLRERHTMPRAVLEYRLQFADLMLDREASGWRLLPASKTFQAIRMEALSAYKNRLLNPSEAVIRERLERMPPLEIKLRAIRHVRTGAVRLLLPVRRGKSFKTAIDSLPSLSIVPRIDFELVCSEPHLAAPAKQYLERWSARTKTTIRVHQHPHYRTRKPPEFRRASSVNRYERFGLDPLRLI